MPTPTGAATIAALNASADELGQVLALHRAGGVEEPERLGVAEGDRRLLALHRELTGRDLELAVTCRACGATSVAVLSADTVPLRPPCSAVLGPGGGLRAPVYGDLLDLPADAAHAELELLRRCVVGAPASTPGPEALERIDDALTGPLGLECVECGTALQVAVDAERLALEGLQRHAGEVELEVHLLARAYGWDLPTIEALPDERRRRLASFVAEGR